jgi:hypothetical protein
MPLNKDLKKLLVAHEKVPRPRCGLFALDTSFFENISGRIAEYLPAIPQNIPDAVASDLVGYLDDYFCAAEESVVHGASWDVPGLYTVTVNPKIGKLIGLHLDSWDGASFANRDRSRTRLCVNLGPDIRSFLYVPIRLFDAAKAIVHARAKGEFPDVGDIIPGFLSTFPEFPVIRINMLPGMGYFADTDNLIHDGSSALASRPSIHFTMRGRFHKL